MLLVLSFSHLKDQLSASRVVLPAEGTLKWFQWTSSTCTVCTLFLTAYTFDNVVNLVNPFVSLRRHLTGDIHAITAANNLVRSFCRSCSHSMQTANHVHSKWFSTCSWRLRLIPECSMSRRKRTRYAVRMLYTRISRCSDEHLLYASFRFVDGVGTLQPSLSTCEGWLAQVLACDADAFEKAWHHEAHPRRPHRRRNLQVCSFGH